MNNLIWRTTIIMALIGVASLEASEESIGPNGINSINLGLDGSGVAIGQVEPGRPGKDTVDNDPNCCNEDV